MPTTHYKEPRVCECGYSTLSINNWAGHKKRCKGIGEVEQLKHQVKFLEEQLDRVHDQLAMKDEQIKAQSDEIKSLLAESCADLKVEVKLLRKRKQGPVRVHRTEFQRRQIAKRQNWICADKECTLEGQELREYDIDHIIPLSLGGSEEDDNLQALCPACHRKKTDKERLLSTATV